MRLFCVISCRTSATARCAAPGASGWAAVRYVYVLETQPSIRHVGLLQRNGHIAVLLQMVLKVQEPILKSVAVPLRGSQFDTQVTLCLWPRVCGHRRHRQCSQRQAWRQIPAKAVYRITRLPVVPSSHVFASPQSPSKNGAENAFFFCRIFVVLFLRCLCADAIGVLK